MRRLYITITLVLASISILATAQTPAEPGDLTKLRDSWKRAVQQANAPLDKKYEEALAAMKTRFTKDGKLQEALAVDSELKMLSSRASSPQVLNALTPSQAQAGPDAAPTPAGDHPRLKQFQTVDELGSWLAKTKWVDADGNYIKFTDSTHFVAFEAKAKAISKAYSFTSKKVGVLTFYWSNSSESSIEIKSDLKELIYNGKKHKFQPE